MSSKILLTISIILFLGSINIAQNLEIDSLNKKLYSIKNIDSLSKEIHKIGAKIMIYDTNKASLYVKKLDSIFKKHNNKYSLLLKTQLEAKILRWEDKPHKSIEKYLDLLNISSDSITTANAEFNLGILYTNLRLNNQALKSFNKALEIFQKKGRKKHFADIYNCIADIYNYNLFKFKKAEEYYLKALSSYMFLSEKQKNRTESIQTLSVIHNNLGRLYIYLQQFKKSESHLIQSLELADSMNDKIGKLHVCTTLAELYNKQKKYNKSYTILKDYKNSIEEYSLYLQSEYYREWSKSLAGIKQYDKAFYANKKYTRIQDSLYNSNLSAKLAEMKNKYENEKSIEDNKHKEKMKQQEYRYFILSLVIILLVLVIFYVTFKTNAVKIKRLNTELNEKLIELKNNEMKIENVNNTINTNILNDITEKLNSIIDSNPQDISSELRKIISSIRSNIRHEELDEIFKSLHGDFFVKLLEKHPRLSPNDRKISALIKLQFSNNDIAKMLKVETNSVNVAKSRLRKKLNIDTETDLFKYLSNF
ncbi:MAG: hypothetical protein N4A49_11685 [Marinifilaceae bacterium]|jgi:DNA-binding CsgD family transcriptional regulator/phage terminase Nu1 subunit (DNA packaging protein)|nr:hypothetical protein [Marinifilaceae bacterium]